MSRSETRQVETVAVPIRVLSVDGKGIVMRREDLRPATRRVAESRQRKLSTRHSKGQKSGSRRMTNVAAVYGIDRYGRAPEEAWILQPIEYRSP